MRYVCSIHQENFCVQLSIFCKNLLKMPPTREVRDDTGASISREIVNRYPDDLLGLTFLEAE